MAIAEITALITASTVAFDIAKGVKSLKGEVERNESVSKLLETLLSVQAQALEVQAKAQDLEIENHEIKKKLMAVEDWKNTEENYELKDLGAGAFVYAYKKTEDSNEPMHHLCPKCFNDKKKFVLQSCYESDIGVTCYSCLNCNSKIFDKANAPPQQPYDSSY